MMTPSVASHSTRNYYWLLIFVGACVVVAMSFITTVEYTDAPRLSDDLEITLGGISRIEQTFTSDHRALVGLKVRVEPQSTADVDLRIPLDIRASDDPATPLVRTHLLLQDVPDDNQTVRFAPLQTMQNPYVVTQTFHVVLTIPSLPPASGPLITLHQTQVSQGQLSIDGSVQANAALVITPIYQHRWIDDLWPISAIAYAKPGLFGWPPFYTLLAYCWLITVLVGVKAIHRAYSAQMQHDD